MTLGSSSFSPPERRRRWKSRAVLIAGALAAGACAGAYSLPAPRPLVVRSGARVYADEARLNEIDIWVRDHQENIVLDPSFLIAEKRSAEETYPWDALTIIGDTAEILVYSAAPESGSFLSYYGHFHLMDRMDRLDEFLPEAVAASFLPSCASGSSVDSLKVHPRSTHNGIQYHAAVHVGVIA